MSNPENAIAEVEAILAAKNNAITAIKIDKNGTSFNIIIKLNWREGELFISSTRRPKEPRIFKHSGRLIEYIEAHFPNIKTVELRL